MKKVLLGLFALSLTAMAAEGTHVYLKAGLDPYGKFKKISDEGQNWNKSDRKDVGYEFSVEATQSVLPEVEVGVGLGYQDHGRPKVAKDEDGDDMEQLPRFKSIPLYLTAKYNLPLESEFHPYLKADLGYSFNMKSSKTYKDEDAEVKFSYKNGIYWGIGAGVEYQNFVADLMYKMNYGKVRVEYKNEDETGSLNKKFDYGRVTLSVGYRFDF